MPPSSYRLLQHTIPERHPKFYSEEAFLPLLTQDSPSLFNHGFLSSKHNYCHVGTQVPWNTLWKVMD
jgi:hypothetical protein